VRGPCCSRITAEFWFIFIVFCVVPIAAGVIIYVRKKLRGHATAEPVRRWSAYE